MEAGVLQIDNTVFILGAGPAGVSLSHYLSELGIKNVLIEARSDVGGMARSWEWNEFIVDTGPHILHTDDLEIWGLWKNFLRKNLTEGNFYSGNYKTINKKSYIYDYPLNTKQIVESKAWSKKQAEKIIKNLTKSNRLKNLGEAISFKEYMTGLVGEDLEESFFRYYPEKVWGISTDNMLPDWAPKRIRICKDREPFYKGELAGIAAEGTGELMKKIVENSCKKFTKIRLNSKVTGLKTYKNKITKIKILEKGIKEHYISVKDNDLVVNTLPINLISEMLGKKFDISFRGIASIYVELSQQEKKEKILPSDFNWLYFGDKKINFNRITEPTSMSNRLDKTFTGRKYLIIETCLDHNSSKSNIENKVDSAINDLCLLPFINKEIISTSYNWEKFVYPIQTLENRINLKDIQSYISEKAKNIESLGTSADFAYNDIQVIFKKAMELSLDIRESNNFNLSKIHFSKLIDKNERENLFIKNNMNEENFNEILINTYKNPQKCRIIAEIGINHNGSISQLYKLCELACESGADIVKFQYFDAKKRIGSSVRELEHIEKAQDMEENILELLDRCEISLNDLCKAKDFIISQGSNAMCTPFSTDSFKELIENGFEKIKISSMDLNNYHLHKEIVNCEKKLDLFISTGMSSISEIKIIYEIYKDSAHNICLLLCTSSYPAPNNDISLSNILLYKSLFPKFKIGYSDHTVGVSSAIAAATLGAEYIEIHFSDDVRKSGPDQILSKTVKELKELNSKFNMIKDLIKFKEKDLRPSEYSTWRTQKKGLYAKFKIKKGELITTENTVAESPPTNISPLILNTKEIRAKKDIFPAEEIKNDNISI